MPILLQENMGNEAAQFPEKEHIMGFSLQCVSDIFCSSCGDLPVADYIK
jgi:hypothetical protein